MRQWRDDVDRLLHLAQATPGSAGAGSRFPPNNAVVLHRRRQGGASASVHSPTMRIARTEDLRAELNRRRAGEDAFVSMLWAREHRLNIEGHNLDANLDAAAPKSPGNARTQAGTPVARVGCAALADLLRVVAWPFMFRPHLPEKYDGMINPSEFLQVYVTAIIAAGGNDAAMASYFHVALPGPARTWLMNLTSGSIQTWGESVCSSPRTSPALTSTQHRGSPPRRDAEARRDAPGLHLTLYQGTGNNPSYFRCIYYYCLLLGGT